MGQQLKQHIREAIINAALCEFARCGFTGATISGIAKNSGISTGNIYRYFSSKKELFDVAVPKSFVTKLLRKFRQRIAAYPLDFQPNEISDDSDYYKQSKELLDFTINNRLRTLIVLEGSAKTRYESFLQDLRRELTEKAIHMLNLNKLSKNPEFVYSIIDDIYRNYLQALSSILRRYSDPSDIRAAVSIYANYHLGGLSMIKQ